MEENTTKRFYDDDGNLLVIATVKFTTNGKHKAVSRVISTKYTEKERIAALVAFDFALSMQHQKIPVDDQTVITSISFGTEPSMLASEKLGLFEEHEREVLAGSGVACDANGNAADGRSHLELVADLKAAQYN